MLVFINYWIEKCTVKHWNTIPLILDFFMWFNWLFSQQFCLYAIDGRMIGCWWTGINLVASCCDVIETLLWPLPGDSQHNYEKFLWQGGWCSDQDAKQAHTECKSAASHFYQSSRLKICYMQHLAYKEWTENFHFRKYYRRKTVENETFRWQHNIQSNVMVSSESFVTLGISEAIKFYPPLKNS